MKKSLIALLMVVAMSVPAFAGTDYNVCFSTLDADGDGAMSKSEFSSAFDKADEAVFTKADADKDGSVSHDEWEDFKASQGFEEGEHHG